MGSIGAKEGLAASRAELLDAETRWERPIRGTQQQEQLDAEREREERIARTAGDDILTVALEAECGMCAEGDELQRSRVRVVNERR